MCIRDSFEVVKMSVCKISNALLRYHAPVDPYPLAEVQKVRRSVKAGPVPLFCEEICRSIYETAGNFYTSDSGKKSDKRKKAESPA